MLLVSSNLFAQTKNISIGKIPDWVTKSDFNYSFTNLDKDASDGYIDEYLDKQISMVTESIFYHLSKKILSQAGVQNGSQISITYDPGYEQLILHDIHLIRNGNNINKLDLKKIKVLHQEEELSNFIYNGNLNAVLILEDVREGDIIEYSYSVKGFNPIFNHKYFTNLDVELSYPIYGIYYKLIVPNGRTIHTQSRNTDIKPTVSSIGGLQVYEWQRKNIPPKKTEDNLPAWYDPFGEIMISEYNNWKEVNDWAMTLFPLRKNLSKELKKKVQEIDQQNPLPEDKISAAVHFVEDEIRYMGIEIGPNSHQPADPDKVFHQRFGDCKEKSYLLFTMLAAMNIESNPILINADKKIHYNELIPSPGVFNHVTLRVKLGNEWLYFDPTISSQRGNIKNLYFPDFKKGLVLSPTTTALTDLHYNNNSSQDIFEHFRVEAMSGEGFLTVTTTYKGMEADLLRGQNNSKSNADILSNDQKFYAKYYENIQADSVIFKDDKITGNFITYEYYHLPEFWTTDKDSTRKFAFSPFIIDNILQRSKDKNRKMPLSLSFPANYHEEVLIELPEEWYVTKSMAHLKNAGFEYTCTFKNTYNKVQIIADYINFKDFVSPEESVAYFNDLKAYDERENFEIEYGTKIQNKKNIPDKNPYLVIFWLIILGGGIGGVIWRNNQKSNKRY